MSNYYNSLFQEVLSRSVDATLGILGIKNPNLRKHLRNQLENELSEGNRILSDVVFEATFPWQEIGESFQDLSKRGFLNHSFVSALDHEHKKVQFDDQVLNLSSQAMKQEWHPRTHQLKSWEILKEEQAKSIVVTSGTGSGKTECFMVPILDDLVRQQEASGAKLEGIQALFIYPLNALINSQRERILSWTLDFEDKVRFCLYNGNTPRKPYIQAVLNGRPKNEIYDRTHLWQSPPPILITNPTMLEYMMIRTEDRAILEASQGKLKYIVLDEAHTYVGSQAAELALLIRRVLNGFGVEAENVRFIATSATIGDDEESKEALKNYLADIGGINPINIEVVDGARNLPNLKDGQLNDFGYTELVANVVSGNLNTSLENKTLREIRNFFIDALNKKVRPRKLTDVAQLIFPGQPISREIQEQTLMWLDLASHPDLKENGTHFLPLKGHFFHKVLNGLWACSDSKCHCKQGTSLEQGWKFGKVYTSQRLNCECGAPVYELVFCKDCNEAHLVGELHNGETISQQRQESINEFELNQESSEEDDANDNRGSQNKVVLYHLLVDDAVPVLLNQSGQIGDEINKYPYRLFYIESTQSANETCFNCGYKGGGQEAMRHAYLGMPFYIGNLVPTLLEHVPDGNQPLTQPCRGRRLLTFTDSRQGTAKIAVKIQQDAERTRTRGLIFKSVLKAINQEEIVKKQGQISELENVTKSPTIEALIKDIKGSLHQLLIATKTKQEEQQFLSNEPDVSVHVLKSYKRLDSRLDNVNQIVDILLIKEFSRRPKRVNSLESLGLVATHYPTIDRLEIFPIEFGNNNLTLQDWKDFLKLTIDFFLRDGIYVSIPDDLISWLGGNFRPKFLLSPNSNQAPDFRHKKWPEYNPQMGVRQHRLIRLLSFGLKIDLSNLNAAEIDTINIVLGNAWSVLTQNGILRQVGNGHQMSMDVLSFKIIKNAWRCPVSMKLLDTTFKGLTPYIPFGQTDFENYTCEPIEMPNYPQIVAVDNEDYRKKMRAWAKNDERVQSLKIEGLWSDQSDRIIEGGNFIRSAEHSAQQPIQRLQEYEKDFKKGYINVLSCSTTMEMGVDIGGLSMVCNNNVPPHPANYLQRAGRAGRRNESRSTSITLCKNNPHDQQVFLNPIWPFEAKMKKPKITLSSVKIVNRHINAYLFGWYLNHDIAHTQQNQLTLNCEWFFEGQPSFCERMIVWMEGLATDCPDDLSKGLLYIKRNTIIENVDVPELMIMASEALAKVSSQWNSQLHYYLSEQAGLTPAQRKANPALVNRINYDLQAHRRTYLLSVLISGGFLPGYGFPTNISTFNTSTIQEFNNARRRTDEDREEGTLRIAGKPTRNTAIALSEYAPGAQIVLDGKVYTSHGITLNFQNPDDNVVNYQFLRRAWRCRSCGSTGLIKYGNQVTCNNHQCPNPKDIEWFEYIQPTGFATSLYENPTNNISKQAFIPSETPWINTHHNIQQLINPALGSYISDPEGEIFHHNKGINRNGFAVCLSCGYAESLNGGPDSNIPNGFNAHKKLRGVNADPKSELHCNPNPNSIKKLTLGFADKTDLFELYLRQPTGEYFLVNADNLKLAWTLGVALRHGLAKTLGINAEELGIAIKPSVNRNLSDRPIYALCMYDTNSGGSGFSTLASQPHITKTMFEHAKELLSCHTCQNACQNCLMQFDTKEHIEYLDRKVGLAYLTTDFMNSLGLPQEEKIFGENSTYCIDEIFNEFKLQYVGRQSKLQVFLAGDSSEWSINDSSLKKNISSLVGNYGKFEKLELLMAKSQFEKLDRNQKLDFFYFLASDTSISIHLMDECPTPSGGGVLLSILTTTDGKQIVYGTKETTSNYLSEDWGNTKDELLIKSIWSSDGQISEEVDKKTLLPQQSPNSIQIPVILELNSTVRDFGKKFWELVKLKCEKSDINLEQMGELRLVDYSDRYLKSPISVMLLSKVLESSQFNTDKADLNISWMNTDEPRKRYLSRRVIDNWYPEEEEDRVDFIKSLNQNYFDNIDVVSTSDNKRIPHSRELSFEFQNGKSLNIRLDQGFGYWFVDGYPKDFPFESSIEEQLECVIDNVGIIKVKNQSGFQTYFDVSIED